MIPSLNSPLLILKRTGYLKSVMAFDLAGAAKQSTQEYHMEISYKVLAYLFLLSQLGSSMLWKLFSSISPNQMCSPIPTKQFCDFLAVFTLQLIKWRISNAHEVVDTHTNENYSNLKKKNCKNDTDKKFISICWCTKSWKSIVSHLLVCDAWGKRIHSLWWECKLAGLLQRGISQLLTKRCTHPYHRPVHFISRIHLKTISSSAETRALAYPSQHCFKRPNTGNAAPLQWRAAQPWEQDHVAVSRKRGRGASRYRASEARLQKSYLQRVVL